MKQKEALFFVGSLLSVFTLFGALKPPLSPRGASYCYVTNTKQSAQQSNTKSKTEKPTLPARLAPITQPLSYTAQATIAQGREASETALKAETVLQFMRTNNAQGQALENRSIQLGRSTSLVLPAKSKRLPQASSMPSGSAKSLRTVAKVTKHGPKTLMVRPKPVSTTCVRDEQISQTNPDTPSLVAVQELKIVIQMPRIPPATASSQSSPSSQALNESQENLKESSPAANAAHENAQELAQIILPATNTDHNSQECCSCCVKLSCAWMICCNIWNAES